MDVVRTKKPRRGRAIAAAAALAIAAGGSVAVGRMKDAAPLVDPATVTIGKVVRGTMIREVRAPGTLVPVDIRWITAQTSGRVERIAHRAGATVTADTVLVELSNPDVVLAALQTDSDLASAEADLLQQSFRLRSDRLTQENVLWSLKQDADDAGRRAGAYARGKGSVVADLDAAQMRDRSDALGKRVDILDRQVRVLESGLAAQVAALTKQVERRREVAAFRRKQVDDLNVRAAGDGVLSDMPLELGQWVVPGNVLAKVVKPDRLKAVLRVAEVQAKDVAIGEPAKIDTRNGVAAGHVGRIAPAATQGMVLVEVFLDGDLPAGARPDLNVDGTIEIERLEEVVHVERPVGAQQDRPMTLFRVTDDGKEAQRIPVEIGRVSVKEVEIKGGLGAGARVVLSDMSRWDSVERVALR